ncbi:hypothetical protein BHE74_00007868 [Ensete ventricosum]|uniref:Uncharacterized protein n=1 Tax=Ensete ventricosum TaxID=4639 RepID=A0A427ANZ5_ENSVE|nr:hypothetical protein B296_00027869 [Ensete ventricosum]RWW06335.1 hypothetical protein GW17_00030343 [Ensete ventricosum]RWW83615.1 hypothetical protein BHE74_00007868 [Ensete ventricosum]RZS00521.1 hypothetical protein BHM03_00030232 [Ensete ventricosum]
MNSRGHTFWCSSSAGCSTEVANQYSYNCASSTFLTSSEAEQDEVFTLTTMLFGLEFGRGDLGIELKIDSWQSFPSKLCRELFCQNSGCKLEEELLHLEIFLQEHTSYLAWRAIDSSTFLPMLPDSLAQAGYKN